jgi:ketosteroid isomerase-like protein
MSEENLAVVFEHIDAINRGDVEAVVATVSPDVEWEDAMFYSESPRIYSRSPAASRASEATG